MLDYNNGSLQTKIDRHCYENGILKVPVKQTLSKALAQFYETPFIKIYDKLIEYIYKGDHPLKTYNDRLLFAVDGTYFDIPKTHENAEYFDPKGKTKKLKVGGSMIYDVLNNVPFDFKFTKCSMNEREVFLEQLTKLKTDYSDVLENGIFAFDMGYPSAKMKTFLTDINVKYVMRNSKSYLKEVNKAPLGDNIVTTKDGIKTRVIKFLGKRNVIITLCTNLFDFPMEDIMEIYRLRWVVETSFNTMKNKLFSDKNQGKTVNFVKQSLWATLCKMERIFMLLLLYQLRCSVTK
jgi:hypothetical protein